MSPPQREHGPNGREELTARLFRAVNERIHELAGGWGGDYAFVCECEDEHCTRAVRMTLEEYEALRQDPSLSIVLPGHERPEHAVARRSDDFVVVHREGAARANLPRGRARPGR